MSTSSSALVVGQHQKQRLGSSTSGFPSCICETHPHKRHSHQQKHLQIETITEHHFFVGTVCELSLVIIQAACLTHMGYTTIQYIYSSSEWITDKCGLSLCFSLSVLHPIHSSAHVLMSENRLFPRADIAAPFFGTRDTLRWWFRAAPAAAPSQQGICRLCTEHVRGASSCKTGRFS